MNNLFPNRYLDALAKTVLLLATIHLLILGYLAFRSDLAVLNAFNILSLDAFFPDLDHGAVNFASSYFMVLGAYCLVYLYLTRPAGKNE